ncbi:DNA polymerase family A-domain-containing protein [Morchella snyderi]|nr:DNA polymerase family A-domain-containing protein [Morchella snyderi]
MLSTCLRTRGRPQSYLHLQLLRNRYKSTKPSIRTNPLGIQLLPENVRNALFTAPPKKPSPALLELSKDHLRRHDLLSKPPSRSEPVDFQLPALAGNSLDEHFYKLGMEAAFPYRDLACGFAAVDVPPIPKTWVHKSGWTKYYSDGRTEAVESPDEEFLVFDVEVLYKISPFAVMATAVSPHAWYAWLSPWVLGETEDDRHLISLGDPSKSRIVVGHNIGYDRVRVKEEYNVAGTQTMFLDTMSLHVAANGATSKQKKGLAKRNAEGRQRDEEGFVVSESLEGGGHWSGQSSLNSLKDVALFHCGIEMDKSIRDQFGTLDPGGVRKKLDDLLSYCAEDVVVTHKVYKEVLPAFLKVCPHPISFAALRHLSSCILPVNRGWESYITNAEATYHRLSDAVLQRLVDLAEEAVKLRKSPEIYNADPWLRQLDWSGQEVKQLKTKLPDDPPRIMPRKKPGMPKWYKDLFATSDASMSLTVRTRVSPLLLKMAWDGNPLFWSDEHGWCFRVSKVPRKGQNKQDIEHAIEMYERSFTRVQVVEDADGAFYKLPHKSSQSTRCSSPLAKSYQRYFDSGVLSSEYALGKEALDMNAQCAYWISARERIMEQTVVWQSNPGVNFGIPTVEGSQEIGIILPKVVPMGTVTRRASESTWLTAPSPTPRRVGSEIKAMVKSPPGYVFVGADVDSEELWIASLVGDAVFGFHGANGLGSMLLEGNSADGTDMHSRTADLVGVNRDGAKTINYSRIYGAGSYFAAMTLMQLNPALNEQDATVLAEDMYKKTKGTRMRKLSVHERSFWHGGTESFVFNKLETFAEQETPQTPVLGAGITQALTRKNLSPREFMPSRINWVMQSSGVDYLHMLLVAMEYLTKRFNISARIALTIHDEVRYLCAEADKYRCAMALQVANLWTRAMFSEQMGINDLPQSVAWFSAVDIDTVMRKDVDMDCITPSHSIPVPHGESLDIVQLLRKGNKAKLDPSVVPKIQIGLGRWGYKERQPAMDLYRAEDTTVYLKAQILGAKQEVQEMLKAEDVSSKKKSKKKGKAVETEKPLGAVEMQNPLEEAETTLLPSLENLIEQEVVEPSPILEQALILETPPAVKRIQMQSSGAEKKQTTLNPDVKVRNKPVVEVKTGGKGKLSQEWDAAHAEKVMDAAQKLLEQMDMNISQALNPPPPPEPFIPKKVRRGDKREPVESPLPPHPKPRELLERMAEPLLPPHPKPQEVLEIMSEPHPLNHGVPLKLTRAEKNQERRELVKQGRLAKRRKKLELDREKDRIAASAGLPTKREIILLKLETRAKKKLVRERLEKMEETLVASRDLLNLINVELKGAPALEVLEETLPNKQMVRKRQNRIRELQSKVRRRGALALTDEEAWELGELRELELQVTLGQSKRKQMKKAEVKAKRLAKKERKAELKAQVVAQRLLWKAKHIEKKLDLKDKNVQRGPSKGASGYKDRGGPVSKN